MENVVTEIERKYLIRMLPLDYSNYPCKHIRQTYIYITDLTDVRIREEEKDGIYQYYYTVKTDIPGVIAVRKELEMRIDKELYDKLLSGKVDGTRTIEKTRYMYPLCKGLTAEIDLYKDNLTELGIIEVEFSNLVEMGSFKKPEWFGRDITAETEFRNKSLCVSETSPAVMMLGRRGN